jgi:exopolysaccharide biosynthesis polyprenyl glycosylphosphotransferase
MSSSPPDLGGLELSSSAWAPAALRVAPVRAASARTRTTSGYTGTLLVSDVLALGVALAGTLLVLGRPAAGAPAAVAAGVLAATAFIWLGLFCAYGLYDGARRSMAPSGFDEVGRVFHALLAGSLVLVVAGQVLHEAAGWNVYAPMEIALFVTVALVVVPTVRTAARSWAPAGAPARRVLIVGGGEGAQLLARKLEVHGGRGMEIVGILSDEQGGGVQVVGGTRDLARCVDELDVDCVVLTSAGAAQAEVLDRVRDLRRPGVQVSIVPEYFQLFSSNASIDDVAGMPLVNLPAVRLSRGARVLKRSVDIVVSALGLLVIAPVLAVVAVIVKRDSPGPVLFRQVRHGCGGREFRICKFRTMVIGAEAQRLELAHLNELEDGGPLFKIRADPRITGVGAVLRKLSIDELPQLWNVLRGDMSLVGPRPFVVHESARITGWGERRLEATPGITGLWQTLGRNDIAFEEMLQLDYLYVTNWSLWWDIKILCRTLPAVLASRGAY